MMGMTTRRLWVCAGLTGVGALAAMPAAAQNNWVGTGPVLLYDTGSNWSTGFPPGEGEDTIFEIDVAGSPIILGGGSMAGDVEFRDNAWSFIGGSGAELFSNSVTVNDAAATALANGASVTLGSGVSFATDPVFIGTTGYGSAQVGEGSTWFGNEFFVGDGPNGFGELTVTGASSEIRATRNVNTGLFTIGRGGGIGTINVLGGAQMRTSSTGGNDIWVGGHTDDAISGTPQPSIGFLNVDGVGSFVETEDLFVGVAGGAGQMNVTNGGQVVLTDGSSPDLIIAGGTGFNGQLSQGLAFVTGDGSLVNARSISVADTGIGVLQVSDGGVARTRTDTTTPSDIRIGSLAGSSGVAVVFGFASDGVTPSLLDSEDNLVVGDQGLGVLNIGLTGQGNVIGGATLQVDLDMTVGDENALDNIVRIGGASTTANIGRDVFLGRQANTNGDLEISAGASVTVGRNLIGSVSPGATGDVRITGGSTLDVAGNFNIANEANATGLIHVNASTLMVGVDLVTGATGDGTLEIVNGSTVTLGDELIVGLQNGSNSTALIDGAGTTLTAQRFFIGNGSGSGAGSTGAVTVSNGAVVTLNGVANGGSNGQAVGAITLGDDGEGVGTLTISGAGSKVETTNANGQWFIGGSGNESGGTGTVNIFAGGQGINSARTVLGWGAGANGTLNVDGPGSVFDANGDYILVGFNGTGQMNIGGGGVVNATRVFIGDATGSANSVVNIGDAGSQLNIAGRFHVGDSASGFLNVTDGAQVTVGQESAAGLRFIIGNGPASDGSRLFIDGAGSRVDFTGNRDISVGFAGGSTSNRVLLEVTDGGVFSAPSARILLGDSDGSNGHVIVDGPGSRVEAVTMYVGDGTNNSTGLLDISDGGVVELTADFQGGSNGNGAGTINIGGTGSLLQVGTFLALGDEAPGSGSANGTLNLNTGGVVDVGTDLRLQNTSQLNLSGGTINVGGNLVFVDSAAGINFAFGKMRFANPAGKTFSGSELERILALGGGNRPTLFTNMELAVDNTAVFGGQLRVLGGTLSVGSISAANFANVDFDRGTLNLTNSGLVIGSGGLLGENATITAEQTINVTSSTFINAGSTLTIVGGFSSGTTVNNGDLVVVDTTGSGKTIGGALINEFGSTVTLVGDVTFTGGVSGLGDFFGPGNALFASTFETGNNTSTIDFEGGLEFLPGSALAIEIEGTRPGSEFDRLVVQGEAHLGGELDLQLIGGFVPRLGNSFTVLTSAGLGGSSFDTVSGTEIGGGLRLSVGYTPTDVVVSVITALPGDTDGDGDVDDADLGTSFANYTGPLAPGVGGKTLAQGDTDGDGDVDDADLGSSFSNYTGPLTSASVPEPASLVMLAGLGVLAARRRR